MKWAINAILQWENEEVPSNLLQIHGTKDWILPSPKSNTIIEVQKGEHLTVWTQATEVDEIIKQLI